MGLLQELDALTGSDLWIRFQALCRDFAGTQRSVLADILRNSEGSRFGRERGLSSAMTIDDYRRAVPVQDYAGASPYVEAIASGEGAVLSTLPVERFLRTSGSTGKPKLIPDNASTRATRRNIMAVYSAALVRGHPRALSGKVFPMSAPPIPRAHGTP
ncbi:MAG: GH3 auxin-responsive promoter family protein [Candidatus Riflebacteria bacterium]|nr:GH3 auxin-responsive promoter family protein [Candidatus Riflebacteria bacterium]